ncbi:hypothetical protein AKJ50_02290 [candidate division MSBL1 archaeon SCGC-AAA382A13]|uniref:Crotonase n=1 Tax=candidate division MSBL1 archaeon SCGC-AAA382A13 TaxID=1698279 RepID=A0A133VDK7_9EURY|nr:hypothetical protein AKJ50_02290 [candidate division MSBL1 archaeon SCGC-AAA382A13]
MSEKYDTIKTETKDNIFYLTLAREHRLNAINPKMLTEIKSGLEEAEEKQARCIVLKGSGENFSAGADVTAFSPDVQDLYKKSRKGKDVFSQIESAPMPVVAGIQGNCLGGGLEMTLACDFRIAAENAKLGQTETNLGIIPGWGGNLRLPKIVGLAKAKEIIMLGKKISAEEAEEIALVNETVPLDEFEEKVNDLAKKLAQGPPIALKYSKYCMNYGAQVPHEIGKEVESGLFASLASTEDMIEGIEAFMEKRKPEFEGK